MTRHPRMQRASPEGKITRVEIGVPVAAVIRWHQQEPSITSALVVAWTQKDVEIDWITPWGDRRQDWIQAGDVKRLDAITTWQQIAQNG